MKPSLDIESFDQYLSGAPSPEDIAHVSTWAADNLERKGLLNTLASGTLPTAEDGKGWDGTEMWAKFQAASQEVPGVREFNQTIDSGITANSVSSSRSSKSPNLGQNLVSPRHTFKYRSIFGGISAVLALLAVGFIATNTFNPFGETLAPWKSNSNKEIITGSGQRTTIELSDGSRVLLAPESKLTIPENFGSRTRAIRVEGEVYVTAAQDAERPFIVKTGDVETRVLGTRFSVRKYQEDSVVRVAVLDGRVTVSDAVVGAGDVARVVPSGVVTVQAEMNVDRYLGWSKGILNFDDQPLSQVARELGRTYGVRIILEDSTLKDEKITATFDNQPIATILRYLSLALNVDLERSGNTAVLSLRSNGNSVSLPNPNEENE